MPHEIAARRTLTSQAALSNLTGRAVSAECTSRDPILATEMRFERESVASGGLPMTGCGTTRYGGVVPDLGNRWAVEFLVEAGFLPLERFRFAKLDGAICFEEDSATGSIAPSEAPVIAVRVGIPS
jgi:hypothetical protein